MTDVYGMPLEPGAFDRPFTEPRRSSSYGARWSTVVTDLADEASKLGADEVIIGIDLERSRLRIGDGWPKGDVKHVPDHIAVYLPATDHGPLRFLSDRWWGWRDNVRAVGLTLQRLRLVAEAGVAQGGEQYRGWQALPPGRAQITGGDARRVLNEYAGTAAREGDWKALYRRAAQLTHPDRPGGDAAAFARVQAAYERVIAAELND